MNWAPSRDGLCVYIPSTSVLINSFASSKCDKYNEMALNELNVYANKIGGKNAYKILVATKEPIKEPVKMRAKEMGIHLVIFDGNEEKFINKIRKIIINDELSK